MKEKGAKIITLCGGKWERGRELTERDGIYNIGTTSKLIRCGDQMFLAPLKVAALIDRAITHSCSFEPPTCRGQEGELETRWRKACKKRERNREGN